MFKRKEYINNIIHSLAWVQSEIQLSGFAALYDNHIVAEDFFCGFLNLLYGYNLTNVNHIVRNAPAIDLADSENRIAVQVTATASQEKVQSTIKKFLKYELYADYDRLCVLFLGDMPKCEKPVETEGRFAFDKQSDLLDMKDLIQEIKKRSTQELGKLDAYLKEEMNLQLAGREEEGKSGRKPGPVIAGCLVPAALGIICFIAVRLYTNKPYASVYFSKVLPYSEAGYYESFEDVSAIVRTDMETFQAFSILSFARNYGNRNSVIEDVYCDILDLTPIEEAGIRLDAVIVDNIWKLYAVNDGWGKAGSLELESVTIKWSNGEQEEQLDIIVSDQHIVENEEVASAKAALVAEYALDCEKFEEFCENRSVLYPMISATVSEGENSYTWSAYLYCIDGKFDLDYGGLGGPEPFITLFALLNVDSRPERISFTGLDSTPVVGDTLRIETVIAPTKSCEVTCRNVFMVNGKQQQTDSFTVRVTVPVFADGAVGCAGMMTRELAQMDRFDEDLADRIAQKYLYNPDSIREAFGVAEQGELEE